MRPNEPKLSLPLSTKATLSHALCDNFFRKFAFRVQFLKTSFGWSSVGPL